MAPYRLLVVLTLAGALLGFWLGRAGSVLLFPNVPLPRGALNWTPAMTAALIQRHERRRLCIAIGIALGGAFGLLAYDAAMRRRQKRVTARSASGIATDEGER